MRHFLDFEKPIASLEGKVEELRHMSSDGSINIADEIGKLQPVLNVSEANLRKAECMGKSRLLAIQTGPKRQPFLTGFLTIKFRLLAIVIFLKTML